MDKHITENNKLIAEFMAGQPVETHHNQYHTSWNELMPVVERIENMGNTIVTITKHCEILPVLYSTETDSMVWHEQITAVGQTKIEATYKAVVRFIEWYNSQN